MEEVALALLFGWKPVAAAFVLGLVVSLVPNPVYRRRALWAVAGIPILIFVVIAASAGCLPAAGKPQCAGIAWGLTLLPVQWLIWVAVLALGAAMRRLAVRRGGIAD